MNRDRTDEWGVTYSANGRTMKFVNNRFNDCEHYVVPEGVVDMNVSFMINGQKLRSIKLPSTLRRMDCNTFVDCPIEKIVIPEGVVKIPDFMCECCKELKRAVLPQTTKIIGNGAFCNCKKLSEINMPDSIEDIGEHALSSCKALVNVKLPPKIERIRPQLFYCSGIETIDIHKNITEIGYFAFWGCNSLKRLVIPEWVKHIEYGIVSAHEGFEGIECHAKGYHVENDALICDENQELLCCWSRQKHYTVPECVKRIAEMGGNPFVETITVKQPVELTTYDVFASNINLRNVDFQGGAFRIDHSGTFYNCPKLENDIATTVIEKPSIRSSSESV